MPAAAGDSGPLTQSTVASAPKTGEIHAPCYRRALRMVLNVGDICSSRGPAGVAREKTALRLVRSDLSATDASFADIDILACRFANVLREVGQGPGSCVAILVPKCLEVFYAFLGTLKTGSVVLPLFANFGDLGLIDRLADSRATCLLTKRSLLPRIARIRSHLPSLSTILVVDAAEDSEPDVLSLPARMHSAPDQFDSCIVSEDSPSVLHYTSGSTGKPKGVLHQHGLLAHLLRTAAEILKLGVDETYWCTADQGWITGTSYGIVAPWLLGATQVQFCGNFDAASWMQILQDQAVSIWYTAPTALRMMMVSTEVAYSQYDLTRLRYVFSVGEPLNPEVSRWALEILGKEIFDTWFQTETGGIMIANRPGLAVRRGSMGRPVPDLDIAICDDHGNPCQTRTVGRLCLKQPMPALFATYLNRPEAYASRFFNGYYDSGDLAHVDEDGYVWFAARNDDVINTSGHLVSPFEIESALLEMPEVAESGAVGVPDPILFEKVVAFVALKPGNEPSEELALRVRLHVANRLSSTTGPQDVVFVDTIPKNNSGKILRRVLRAQYQGHDPGDLSTLQGET